MGVTFAAEQIGAVPVLLAKTGGPAGPLPAVLWFHGFSADKETHRPELERLAHAGLLAVGVDCAGHGARRLHDFEQRFAGNRDDTRPLFFELIRQTVAEVPRILDRLVATKLADPRRIAASGVSMGGHIVYGAVLADRRIRAAAALLASPTWPGPDSPSARIDEFFPAALLSITAERDDIVPPRPARDFHRALQERYRQCPERLRYREIAGGGHLLDPPLWEAAVREAADWLVAFTN